MDNNGATSVEGNTGGDSADRDAEVLAVGDNGGKVEDKGNDGGSGAGGEKDGEKVKDNVKDGE